MSIQKYFKEVCFTNYNEYAFKPEIRTVDGLVVTVVHIFGAGSQLELGLRGDGDVAAGLGNHHVDLGG